MATVDLDALLDSLRRLSSDERAKVKALIERLDPKGATRGDFQALSGVVSDEDAALMRRAVEDCERIDPGGW